MSQRKNAIQFVLNQLIEDKQHSLRFLIEYGSRLKGHDVDLVAIFTKAPPHREVSLGNIDMVYYEYSQTLEMAGRMDPLITEPVMTGELLWGDLDKYKELLAFVGNPHESSQSVGYLLSRCFQEYLSAQNFIRQYQLTQENQLLLWALINLSFAAAHLGFTGFYARNQLVSPITKNELEQKPEGVALRDTMEVLRRVKNRPNWCLTIEEVDLCFDRFNRQILGHHVAIDRSGNMSEKAG